MLWRAGQLNVLRKGKCTFAQQLNDNVQESHDLKAKLLYQEMFNFTIVE